MRRLSVAGDSGYAPGRMSKGSRNPGAHSKQSGAPALPARRREEEASGFRPSPTPAGRPGQGRLVHPAFVCLALALVTFAIYAPVARHGFVDYDDSDYVLANPHVQGGLTRANMAWAFTTGHASNWHPLTWLSHELDCQLFGERAGAHHLVNVLFHVANTLLLFLLLRRATGALWRSALVAALFALHPLHVESVAWVSERKDVLSALFFLLTVWAYVRYAEERSSGVLECRNMGKSEARNRESQIHSSPPPTLPSASNPSIHQSINPLIPSSAARFYALSLFFFALGLMSKPMLVTTPFVLLLLDYWPLRRVRSPAFKLVLEKVPFFLLSAASSVITFVVQRKGGAVSSLTTLSLGARAANAVVSYARYLGKTFWPVNLSVLYPHPGHWPAWRVSASAVLLLAICAGVLVLGRKRPYLAVGWFWFLGTLAPVIGLVQVGMQSMADRYMYLPLIGLSMAVVWGVAGVIGNESDQTLAALTGAQLRGDAPAPSPPGPRPGFGSVPAFGLAVAALLLCLCALLSSSQLRYWRNSETLFRHATEATSANYLAYNNLGFYLSKHGQTAEAMRDYQKSLEINPAYADALNNYGFALAGQKRYREAIGYYEAALRNHPGDVEIENNFGNALSELGQLDAAIGHYLSALRQNPDHADAQNGLGITLAMQGKLDEAIPHFRAALRAKPGYASPHSNLGNALAAQRKFAEATTEYEEALRLEPNDARSQNNLGNVLAEQGRLEEAIVRYTRALELNADNPEAQFNLGMALLRRGERASALPHFTAALRLKPDYAEARKQLEALGMRE
jgi:tetratricopeptide (TPR) repeat protein